MKATNLILMMVVAIGLLASCNKEENEVIENEEILGIWNLTSVQGGLVGVSIQYDLGDIVWDFEDENTLVITNNVFDTEEDQGFSGLESGTYIYEVSEEDGIEYLLLDDNSKSILSIEGDNLELDQGLPVDGLLYGYQR